MLRRFRHVKDRPRSARRIAALVSACPVLAALLQGLAQGAIHPVAGVMVGAIAAAVAARWFIRHFAPAIARHLETVRSAPVPRMPPPRGPDTVSCSRWRRLEAARTCLVVPKASAEISRPTRV